MLIFTCLLAFYLAWNLGANDVANSMGTSVGSKALTLRQAIVIAGILEFTGAVLFGREVSTTLATKITCPQWFADAPEVLLMGMVAVLIACGVWLNLATALGLPVSSSHAIVGAIAGFAWVAASPKAVDWASIKVISLTWLVTPLVSGAIAVLFYSLIKRWILDQPDPLLQLQEWVPWLSTGFFGVFGVIVLKPLLEAHPILSLPSHTISLVVEAIAAIGLTFYSWRFLRQGEVQRHGGREAGEELGVRGQEAEKLFVSDSPSFLAESLLSRFQVLSACFVAFAHGSNDVGNAIAPLATIVYIQHTGTIPQMDFMVSLWLLVLGGIGIVVGLAVWGKRVIATVGEGIIPLQPSGGFCAELATATTILLASRAGLPVSTSHALVGAVVGIGLVQQVAIRLQTLRSVLLAWVVTIPLAGGLAAGIFALERGLGLFLP